MTGNTATYTTECTGEMKMTAHNTVKFAGDGYTLDLFLIPSRQGDSYWQKLEEQIARSERTTLHPAVAPDELPAALNPFDLGIFLLPRLWGESSSSTPA